MKYLNKMTETSHRPYLSLDKEYVNSLDLPTLIKMLPIYKARHKEVTHRLVQLQAERTGLEQRLAQIDFEKCQSEKLLSTKKQAYQEVALRERNVQIELSRLSLMCPIYELQMEHFLQQQGIVSSDAYKTSANSPAIANCLTVEENLNKQRELLAVSMEEKQKDIDDFVNKFLN